MTAGRFGRWSAIWLALFVGAVSALRAQKILSPNAPLTRQSGITWVRFEDPLEKAFTLDVPQGWTIKGGMFRLGYSDERIMVDLEAPDGRVSLRLGDVAIPTYFIPDQLHHEGDVYDLGAQAQGTVARYRTGAEFAVLYGQARFKGKCPSLSVQTAERAEPAQGYLPPDQNKSSSGQTEFRCPGGGPGTAYAWARTTQFGALWQVQSFSFMAPPDRVALAYEVAAQTERTFKLSPAWIETQKKNDEDALVYQRARQRQRQLSQQVAQFEARMQAMQNQVAAFERGQARQAAQVEAFGNLLTGIIPTVDPLGNRHDVFIGPKNGYWTNGRGDYVNSDTSPGPGWQPLRPAQ